MKLVRNRLSPDMKFGEVDKLMTSSVIPKCCGKQMGLTGTNQIQGNYRFTLDCKSCDEFADLYISYAELKDLGIKFY